MQQQNQNTDESHTKWEKLQEAEEAEMTSCSPEIQASGFNQKKKSKKRKLLPNSQAKQSNQNKNNNSNLNTYLQENFGSCLSAQVKRWERV